ncbi:MAG: hypothetical protein FJW36_05320 [Acidobacteria bacterium]|nr:hypothetical protein [Acidobacteriota bacterium]
MKYSLWVIGMESLLFALYLLGYDAITDLKSIRDSADALTRRSRVNEFLKRYPESEHRAAVYEAGALACFELSDTATGLYMARQSLEVYPENPLLTSTMAAVLRNRGDEKGAREYASLARRYLNLFRPKHWEALRPSMEATIEKILGPAPPRQTPVAGQYAGTASCRGCHKLEFDAWGQTGMAKMFRPENSAKREYVEIGLRRYPVDARIGSKWQEAYATKAPDGKLHVLPLQFNKLLGKWVNYWRMIDPPHLDRGDPNLFHQFREVTEYQTNCAPCHTSQWGPKESKEPGINCEMCHGPGLEHSRGKPLRKLSAEESVAVCAQCHAQSAIRTIRAEFPPRYERRPYTDFAQNTFHPNGRFKETTFLVEAFERSACYRKGNATCASCHDPHPKNGKVNQKGLKYAIDDDAMCTQCHKQKHDESARCVECHMPKTMNALLFVARTHQIEKRPLK